MPGDSRATWLICICQKPRWVVRCSMAGEAQLGWKSCPSCRLEPNRSRSRKRGLQRSLTQPRLAVESAYCVWFSINACRSDAEWVRSWGFRSAAVVLMQRYVLSLSHETNLIRAHVRGQPPTTFASIRRLP